MQWMIETSQDILFLVIAASVAVITVLIAWVLVYLIIIIKETREALREIRSQIDRFFQAIEGLKLKFQSTTSTLSLLVEQIRGGVELFRKFKTSTERVKNHFKKDKKSKTNKKENKENEEYP